MESLLLFGVATYIVASRAFFHRYTFISLFYTSIANEFGIRGKETLTHKPSLSFLILQRYTHLFERRKQGNLFNDPDKRIKSDLYTFHTKTIRSDVNFKYYIFISLYIHVNFTFINLFSIRARTQKQNESTRVYIFLFVQFSPHNILE